LTILEIIRRLFGDYGKMPMILRTGIADADPATGIWPDRDLCHDAPPLFKAATPIRHQHGSSGQ
jgi:hypothetical protein